MNEKHKSTKKGVIIIGFAAILAVFILIATESYFNSKELKLAREGCLEKNGIIVEERTFLNLDYTFTCE
ncbi:hypothetical protein ACFSFY_15650 [Sporosarcina siberiensis]|uniref:Uncharacterized protein n=1 Tax=Sporosarcina siberiensis TaxID=1365606 RepID=A0ABW4SJ67_9BACL